MIEPGYLRFIFDELEKGQVNAENAASLPRGLIGLYSKELETNHSVKFRGEDLKLLLYWALVKTEITPESLCETLNVLLEEMEQLISSKK